MSKAPEYVAYQDAKTRCINPHNKSFKNYGLPHSRSSSLKLVLNRRLNLVLIAKIMKDIMRRATFAGQRGANR
jgi:hypothetical protein